MSYSLTFLTGNPNKLAEAQAILQGIISLDHLEVTLQEVQSVEVEEVIRYKLADACKVITSPFFCEDTGLYIAALNGFPGALVRPFLGTLTIGKMAELYGGSRAYSKTALGFYDGTEAHFFAAKMHGRIAQKPRGKGFGYDAIFIPEVADKTHTQTLGEMGMAEKNKISMRSAVLHKLLDYLKIRNGLGQEVGDSTSFWRATEESKSTCPSQVISKVRRNNSLSRDGQFQKNRTLL